MEMEKVEKSLKLETYITRRKQNPNQVDNEKKNRKDSIRRVSLILKKVESLRTPEENHLLESFSDVVRQISKRKERIQLYKERVVEKEDAIEIIERKSEKLAEIISRAKHLVCYTGAGISTSARIPDYRGSQGIWTLLQQGKDIGQHDLSLADPTFTHMALYELHRRKLLRFVVSQNCDGLHMRAGLPKSSLSEVHGNMYVEACKNCKPSVEYWRLFDTTELTARFCHKTNRRCHLCGKPLTDTIVHFGERGSLKWPLNWAGACSNAEKADVILCLGSSLKVLRKYSWLWQMDKTLKKRAKICIINLQWTPKDKLAALKINGKCDDIMRLVMKNLNISVPPYDRRHDPIFAHATLLCPEELHTVSQPMLKIHNESKDEIDEDIGCLSITDGHKSANIHLEANQHVSDNLIADGRETAAKDKKLLSKQHLLKPIKTTPFVKTNLNSKHLLQLEDSSSTDSEADVKCSDIKCGSNIKDIENLNERKFRVSNENCLIGNKQEKCEQIDCFKKLEKCTNFIDFSIGNGNEKSTAESTESHPVTVRKSKQVFSNIQEVFKESLSSNFLHTASDIKDEVLQSSYLSDSHFNSLLVTANISSSTLRNERKTESSIRSTSLICVSQNSIGLQAGRKLNTIASNNDQKMPSIMNVKKHDCHEKELNFLPYNCDSEKLPNRYFGPHSIATDQSTSRNITQKSINHSQVSLVRLPDPKCSFKAEAHLSNSICKIPEYYNDFKVVRKEFVELCRPEECYKAFFEHCKAIEDKLPYWYDVKYAYSGLHSIIQPPPPEINLWSSQVVPIFQMNRKAAECEFCFDNYAEFTCQFYRQVHPDFVVKKYRRGKLIMCECCDYSDEEEENNSELTSKKCEKRAKLDEPEYKMKEPIKVQAGWYGKGYRKNFRRKRK